MLDSPEEYQWMAQAEGSLWWYRTLHHLVARALSTHPAARELRLLDVGCGTGGLLQYLGRRGFRHLEGIDLSPWAIETCRARGLNVWRGDLQNLQATKGHWDAIVCNDALSYTRPKDAPAIMQSLAERLNQGGLLVINLPAFACLGGRHDKAVGTNRRFHPDELRALLRGAGLRLRELRCWPFLLSPAILAARLADRAAARLDYRGPRPESCTLPRWINECLASVSLWETRLLRSAPFGSSVFGVATKDS